MNNIRGYGFRPSDEELIGYLKDIAVGRDSLVQYITQLKDICEFEPWELPGISVLQPGCRVWYFIYPLNYKYHGGKLIKRVTKEGYWKPTGRPRKVMASDTKTEIGSKRSLVFHKGRPQGKKTNTKSDKNKTKHENNRDKTKHGSNNRNKAVWVMHEYQLNTATPPNQKTFFLGKLMKQSEEASISNNKGAKDATTPEDQSDSNKPLAEVEASNDSSGVQNQSSTNEQDNYAQNDETYPQETSNQHNFGDKNEVSNLTSNLGNYVAVDAISRDCVDTSGLLITEPESPNDSAVVQNQFSTNEHGNPSQNLIVVDNKTYPEESSQPTIVAENERSNLLASFENDDGLNSSPMDLSDYDLCSVDELLTMIETADNCNVFQNQFSTNEQDNEAQNDETYPQETSNQHNFVDKNEISNLTSNLGNYVAVDAISRDCVDTSGLLITEPELPNDSAVVQNQFSTNEHGNPSQNLIVVDNKTYPEESSQPTIVAENERSNLLASFENDDGLNSSPMDLSDYDLCSVDELLTMIETADNCNVFQNQSSTNEQDNDAQNDETYPQETSNRHNFVDKNEVSNLTSNLGNYVAVDAISRNLQVDYTELITSPEIPNIGIGPQNQLYTNQQDHSFQSVLIDNDETYLEERSNQHNIIAEKEGFNLPCNFNNYPIADISQMNLFEFDDLYWDGICLHELDGVPEAPNNNGDGIQNQSSINQQVADEFRNSILIDNEIIYPDERSKSAAAEIEGSNLPSLGMTESSYLMEAFRKRSSMEHEGSSIDIETEVAQAQAKKSRFK